MREGGGSKRKSEGREEEEGKRWIMSWVIVPNGTGDIRMATIHKHGGRGIIKFVSFVDKSSEDLAKIQ